MSYQRHGPTPEGPSSLATITPAQPFRRVRPWAALGAAVGIMLSALVGGALLPALLLLHREALPLERVYSNAIVSLVTAWQARGIDASAPGDPRALGTGRRAYTGSCAQCHGAAGDGRGEFGEVMFPDATDLTARNTVEKSDAQLFWIIKYGLSFTGMPGFGSLYSDRDIWALVAYVRALQRGQGRPIAVPTPRPEQLAAADPYGDAVHRGAAVYFAQGCHSCHGPVGEAPGQLALREAGREAERAVRQGRPGMPSYRPDQITDSQLADLLAYLDSFRAREH